jgi:hypothetical protein
MGGPSGIPGAMNRPTGIQETDSLKDFHRAMAVQATSQQVAEFQALVKETDGAKAKVQAFIAQQKNGAAATESNAEINESLQRTRTDTQKFVAEFSAAQKSGLKDSVKKLNKADSDLDADQKKLDAILQNATRSNAEAASRGENLAKSLDDFSDQQLALGREMNIILAQGSDQTFRLAESKNPVVLKDQTFVVVTSGALTQTAAAEGRRTFRFEMDSDLTNMQEGLTEILRTQFRKEAECGESLTIRQAMIVSASPASSLSLLLHYERWLCSRGPGSSGAQELAEGDGSVDLKITPVVAKANSLTFKTEISRMGASGVMAESLRSGDLGDDLRDKLNQAMTAAVLAGANFPNVLPPAVRDLAELQSAKFQDAGGGKLGIALEGRLEASDEQINAMATQLNQAAMANGTAKNSDAIPQLKQR